MLRNMIQLAALVAAVVTLAGAARGQVIEKKTLDREGARRVIAAAIDEAQRRHTIGVVAVVDDGGNLMAVERIDNTFPAGGNISIGKARTAAIFRKPTRDFENIIKNGRTPMVALSDFTPLQGGVPIVIDGQVVGAVGVSGASSAQEDDELATIGAAAVVSPSATARPAAGAIPAGNDVAATHIASDAVREAFAKGAVLFDDPCGNYAVHASVRTQPGQAEIHTSQVDVIHVLDGAATFVTGGRVIEPAESAPQEVRGKAIADGDERRIGKGDVIVVPAGTPHWFKEVHAAPLHYFVVKVTEAPAGDARASR